MSNAVNKLTDADRERARGRIQLGQILQRLGKTAMGLESMKSCELVASRLLLDKALPNLQSISVQTSPDMARIGDMNAHDLTMLISTLDLFGENTSNDMQVLDIAQESGGSVADSGSVDGGVVFQQSAAEGLRNPTENSVIPIINTGQNNGGSEEVYYSSKEQGHEELTMAVAASTLCPSDEKVKQIATIGVIHDTKQDTQTIEMEAEDANRERLGDNLDPDSDGSTQTSSPDEAVTGSGVLEADIAEMQALIEDVRRELHDESGTGNPDSSGNGVGRTTRSTKVVRGSFVPGKGSHDSGKLR